MRRVLVPLIVLAVLLFPLISHGARGQEVPDVEFVTEHIVLLGDSDLVKESERRGWPGNGTSEEPYIVEGAFLEVVRARTAPTTPMVLKVIPANAFNEVKIGEKMAMAVLPASYNVDFELLKQAAGTENVGLAKEDEFRDLFPGCETGAMPPFGNLYDLQVYMSPELTREEHIVFNAGTHAELVDMDFADYARLVRPRIPADTFAT